MAYITKIYIEGNVLHIKTGGTLSIPALSAIVVDGTALTVTAAEVEKLAGSGAVVASGTQAEAAEDPSFTISDITDSASGAEIATAVNSLIDAVETLASASGTSFDVFRAFSMMAESE